MGFDWRKHAGCLNGVISWGYEEEESEACPKDRALMIAEGERLEAENERLRGALAETLQAWKYEANQGDGILEDHEETYEKARTALGEDKP